MTPRPLCRICSKPVRVNTGGRRAVLCGSPECARENNRIAQRTYRGMTPEHARAKSVPASETQADYLKVKAVVRKLSDSEGVGFKEMELYLLNRGLASLKKATHAHQDH